MTKKHQDYIYMIENYYKNPKETFAFLKNKISNKFTNPSVLDIGCARGEFIYFLKKTLGCIDLMGLDYSTQLIEEAQSFKGLDAAQFHVGSAETFELNRKFDVITIAGVLSYFDDASLTLAQCKKHLKPDGRIFILGLFNDYDVDVQIKYRNNKYFNEYQNGWNIHSINTLKNILNLIDMKIESIEIFNLSFELPQQEDPCRSWHIKTEDGFKFTNGLGLIYDMRTIEISHF
jgi:ubiquinone/menaquinone biosynthesis C-methylase UbiE